MSNSTCSKMIYIQIGFKRFNRLRNDAALVVKMMMIIIRDCISNEFILFMRSKINE